MIHRNAYIAIVATSVAGVTYAHFSTASASSRQLNPTIFTPYSLVSTKAVSPTGTILTLRPPTTKSPQPTQFEPWRLGVWSVQIKQPQLQIARSYTPLPPVDDGHETDIRILLRRTHGEIPRYLHSLPLNEAVELRGPFTEYPLSTIPPKAVVFIAGGTGVAPALQMAHSLKKWQEGSTSGENVGIGMEILWASRQREDCVGAAMSTPAAPFPTWRLGLLGGKRVQVQRPKSRSPQDHSEGEIVKQLEDMRRASKSSDGGRLSIRYFVDEEQSFIQRVDIERAIQEASVAGASSRKGLILVAGPDGFVDYVAGPKILHQGMEVQGAVGGLLAQLDLTAWDVWKL